MDFQQKYIKYKTKYIYLQNLYGGNNSKLLKDIFTPAFIKTNTKIINAKTTTPLQIRTMSILKAKGFTEEKAFEFGMKYGDEKHTDLINLIIKKRAMGNSVDVATKEAINEWTSIDDDSDDYSYLYEGDDD